MTWALVADRFRRRSWQDIVGYWQVDTLPTSDTELFDDDLTEATADTVRAFRKASQQYQIARFRRSAAASDMTYLWLKARQIHRIALDLVDEGNSSYAVCAAHDAFLAYCKFLNAACGGFHCAIDGQSCVLDVFPWEAQTDREKRAFQRSHSDWRDTLLYTKSGNNFSQDDIWKLTSRLLTVTTDLPASPADINALLLVKKTRASALRNDSLYRNLDWYFREDLIVQANPTSLLMDLQEDVSVLHSATRGHFHSLIGARAMCNLSRAMWNDLTNSSAVLSRVVLNGQRAQGPIASALLQPPNLAP